MKKVVLTLLAITCLANNTQALPLRASTQDPRLHSITRESLPKESRYILEVCVNNQIQITEKMKAEFWAGLSEYGPLNYDKKEFIRDRLLGPEVILMAYLYRDIMISLYLGEPYKSDIRNGYEQHLLKLGVLSQENLDNFEKLTKKMIEADKAEVVPASDIRKTRQGLLQLITKSSQRENRVNQLFGMKKISEIKYPAPAPMINESQSTLLDTNPGKEE
jgi:hypothetical protein